MAPQPLSRRTKMGAWGEGSIWNAKAAKVREERKGLLEGAGLRPAPTKWGLGWGRSSARARDCGTFFEKCGLIWYRLCAGWALRLVGARARLARLGEEAPG